MTDPIVVLAADLGAALLEKGWQVTCAESCTGGGVAAAITEIPGSSSWFGAGFVTYSNEHKTSLLGVRGSTLERVGAVSEEVVREMAKGALAVSGADIAVAVSGIAGPSGGSPDKPVGTVWFAWASCGNVWTERRQFSGDRHGVRTQSVETALNGLIATIKNTV